MAKRRKQAEADAIVAAATRRVAQRQADPLEAQRLEGLAQAIETTDSGKEMWKQYAFHAGVVAYYQGFLTAFGMTNGDWKNLKSALQNQRAALYFLYRKPMSKREQKKMAKFTAAQAEKMQKTSKKDVFQSFRDNNAVCYLRIAVKDSGAEFVVHTGNTVDVVALKDKEIETRGLQPLPNVPVIMAAQRLIKPLSDAVTVTPKAQEILNQILTDKEFQMNIPAKAKKAANTTKAAKGATKKERAPRASKLVHLLNMPKDGEKIAPQALVILQTLKRKGSSKAKGVATRELIESLSAKDLNTKQKPELIWGHYRPKLLAAKFIAVSEEN